MCNLIKIKHVGESDKLPCPMILGNFAHGRASPPDILIKLFESLRSDDGANHRQVNSATATHRKAMSAARDDMYDVTNGRLKPSKH